MFFRLVFSIAVRLIKLPPMIAPGEMVRYCHFNWYNKIHSDHFPIELNRRKHSCVSFDFNSIGKWSE